MTKNHHNSVMLSESIDGLKVNNKGVYVDATFGRGGHTQCILDQLGDSGQLIAFDRDLEAVEFAKSNFNDPRLIVIHSSFSKLENELERLDLIGKIDGILMDLGVSSPQLDQAERGFSFNKDGPLDMRMDQTQPLTAAQWLRQSTELEIADALYLYGEEKRSRVIASTIKKYQKNNEIKTTLDLSNLITSVVRSEKNKHPATRSFQAIRIVINEELKQLSEALEQTIKALAINGRLSVITFHSIEDRIVKQFIRKYSRPKEVPKGLPIITNEENQCALKDLGKIMPSEQEIMTNRRSRSAILRLAQKC